MNLVDASRLLNDREFVLLINRGRHQRIDMPQSVNHILDITPSYPRDLLSILFNIFPDFAIAINRILTFIDLTNKKAHKDDLVIFKSVLFFH